MVWNPYGDRAGRRGEAIAAAYERHRGSAVVDVSRGGDPRLGEAIRECGGTPPPGASADLISHGVSDIRVIEVKSFAGAGSDITPRMRQVETWRAAGEGSWLYVVRFVMHRSHPDELWLVQDPGNNLAWEPAERRFADEGGTRQERFLGCSLSTVIAHGVLADLDGVPMPPEDSLSKP